MLSNCGPNDGPQTAGVLAFPGVPRIFPADAALGLSARIIGEKNTAVNRIFGRLLSANRYSLTNPDPETIHIPRVIFLKITPITRCSDTLGCSPRLRAFVVGLHFRFACHFSQNASWSGMPCSTAR